MWSKIEYVLLHLYILGICAVLIGAFVVQLSWKEFPCPLCLLQRMSMILAAMGPAYIILSGRRHHHIGMSVLAAGFGMAILAAVGGLSQAARQDLLHIAPGDKGYGTPVFGWHLYTWSVVIFLVIIIISGITMLVGDKLVADDNRKMRWFSHATIWIFGIVILANAFNALAISGWHWFLPDNPDSYLLFQ